MTGSKIQQTSRELSFLLTLLMSMFAVACDSAGQIELSDAPEPERSYVVVDTGQRTCYNDAVEINCPDASASYYGQDAQHQGIEPAFQVNGNGTVTDLNTGLMWQQSPDTDGNGTIEYADKLSFDEAVARAEKLQLGGWDDWRLPTIKELYSLMDFSGIDPSGYDGNGTAGLVPFIDTDYFGFDYGDESSGERVIDAQFVSSTQYGSVVMGGQEAVFGVNFADGRIKGYPSGPMPGQFEGKQFYVLYVRGNPSYGTNRFTDNGDGTVTDDATGLMWMQDDSGEGLDWQEALAWVQQKNEDDFLGHSDWRLPNVKELHSIVDYGRGPDITQSAAVDQVFETTSIANEAGQTDYPCYWSSTTHANWTSSSGGFAAYVSFGRAMGYMFGAWTDVHGAGAQRSDPKTGDPGDWPNGHGPQGDAIHIFNFARLVRGG